MRRGYLDISALYGVLMLPLGLPYRMVRLQHLWRSQNISIILLAVVKPDNIGGPNRLNLALFSQSQHQQMSARLPRRPPRHRSLSPLRLSVANKTERCLYQTAPMASIPGRPSCRWCPAARGCASPRPGSPPSAIPSGFRDW